MGTGQRSWLILLIVFASPLSHVWARDLGYDQPYLGRASLKWGNYRAEDIADAEFPKLIASADLIFVGEVREVARVGDAETTKEGFVRIPCAVTVEVVDPIKGEFPERTLRLRWLSHEGLEEHAAAVARGVKVYGGYGGPYIPKAQRYLLFVTSSKGGDDAESQLTVTHSAGVTNHADYENRISNLIRGENVDRDPTLKLLRVAVSGKAPKGYDKELARFVSRWPITDALLPALPADVARSGWHASLERHSWYQGQLELQRFCGLAKDIVERGSDDDILKLLTATSLAFGSSDGKTSDPSNTFYRMAEFAAYDLMRERADERAVRLLIKHAETQLLQKMDGDKHLPHTHPAAVISAAFALAEIGGDDAQRAIRRWRSDPSLAEAKVHIADDIGWLTPREAPFPELLDRALELWNQRKAESPEENR